MTPQDLLDHAPVQSINNVARILQLFRRNGDPNRAAIHGLIRAGKLRQVDPTEPVHRWVVSSAEIRRYIEAGPREQAS